MSTHLSDRFSAEDVEEFNRVVDAVAESVLETSDEDIYQETIDDGDNPEEVAESTRAVLLKALSASDRQRHEKLEGRSAQGSQDFWDSLFLPLSSFLYRRLRASAHLSHEDAEDCAHDALFRIYRNWDSLCLEARPLNERSKVFHAFLSRILHGVLWEYSRSARRGWDNVIEIDGRGGRSPRSGASVIASAFSRLEPDEQHLLSERLIRNKSDSEIAEDFWARGVEVSRVALKSRLGRAIKKLRSSVELESSAEWRCSRDKDHQSLARFLLGYDEAGRSIRCHEGASHLLTVAPSGSGKTSLLISALLTYQGSCVVIDPKGQLAAVTRAQRERLGQNVFVMNPFEVMTDKLGRSAQYNPLASLDPEAGSFQADCDSLAEGLITRDEGVDNFWSDGARQLVSGLIMHLVESGEENQKTLEAVRRVVSGPPAMLRTVVRSALNSDTKGFVNSRLRRFATKDEDSRVLMEIISMATTQTDFLDSPVLAKSMSCSDFSFRDLKEKPTTVYLVLPAWHLHSFSKWMHLLVAAALTHLLDGDKGAIPVLVMLDEFAEVGRLKRIETAICRAPKFGVQIWAIIKDLTQLKQLYRKSWQTMLANIGVQQFFPTHDGTTNEYVSKRYGEATSFTRSLLPDIKDACFKASERTAGSAAANDAPADFQNCWQGLSFRDDHFFMFARGFDHLIEGRSIPYWDSEELQGLYGPDPYGAGENVGSERHRF